MPRSARTGASFEVVRKTQRYFWPEGPLNIWLLFILACGITQIVVFSLNTKQQNQFGVGVPWLFAYGITVGALTIALVVVFDILIITRNLIPGVVIMLSFLFFALYLTSTIETGVELFGSASSGSVHTQCQNNIMGRPVSGQSVATLAWLELNQICQGWYAVFSFNLVGTFLFFGMLFWAAGVSRAQEDTEDALL